MKKFLLAVFIFSFIVYFFTSAGRTPYDYFTRLSEAFLQGRYWLTEQPRWLSELIPAGVNRYYVVYPPMPAIILLPFVFAFGKNFPQQLLAHALGAGIVILTIKLSLLTKNDKKLAIWSGLFIGFGSIVWYLSASGSVWFVGQLTAAFFILAALVESLDKKRVWLVGIFLGAAYLSRTHVILSIPIFLFLLLRDNPKPLRQLFLLGLGFAPFISFDFYYNYVRFGSLFNKGYFLLPAILSETSAPWFAKGVANIAYIPNGLRTMFWSFPKFLNNPPFIQPSWAGLAIWITTPAFIFALRAPLKDSLVKFCWLAILPILVVVLSHGGSGFAQFGYRFAVDFYPFLSLLTIKGVAKTGLKWHHWLLLFLGILINLWGVLWINKFGWVSF